MSDKTTVFLACDGDRTDYGYAQAYAREPKRVRVPASTGDLCACGCGDRLGITKEHEAFRGRLAGEVCLRGLRRAGIRLKPGECVKLAITVTKVPAKSKKPK